MVVQKTRQISNAHQTVLRNQSQTAKSIVFINYQAERPQLDTSLPVLVAQQVWAFTKWFASNEPQKHRPILERSANNCHHP